MFKKKFNRQTSIKLALGDFNISNCKTPILKSANTMKRPDPSTSRKQGYCRLVFCHSQRKLIHESYRCHVILQGIAIKIQKQQHKFYTNNPSYDRVDPRRLEWTRVLFRHHATFDSIAIDLNKEHEMVQHFLLQQGKNYYSGNRKL